MRGIVLGIIGVLFASLIYASENTLLKDGVLDLRAWDFEENPIVPMNGMWMFAYGEQIDPAFYNSDELHDFDLISVPAPWNNQFEGETYPELGYATYYLKILIDNPDHRFAMNIKPVTSSMAAYVNGELTMSQGKPGVDKASTVPSYEHKLLFLEEPIQASENLYVYHVVVHVSNFHVSSGGMTDFVRIGIADKLVHRSHRLLFWEALISGVLLMIFLYHLLKTILYKDRRNLIFTVLSFFAFFLAITNEGRLIYYIFPEISLSLFIKIAHFFSYILPLIVVYYFNELYPEENKKIVINAFTVLYGLNALFILLFPVYFLTKYNFLSIIILSVVVLYVYFHVLGHALLRNKNKSFISLVSMLLVLFAGLNDVFLELEYIKSIYIAHYGLFVFILIQEYILVEEAINEKKKCLEMTEMLRGMNEQLETMVDDRTKELKTQNDSLKDNAEKVEQNNREMKSLQMYQERLSHMLIHDLKAPIGTILHLTDVIESPDANFVRIVKESTIRMQMLVLNLLDIRKLEMAEMKVNATPLNVASLLKSSISQLKFRADAKQISLKSEVNENITVYADSALLLRVFDNLIDNAIKHTPEESKVIVYAEKYVLNSVPAFRIVLEDNGYGISPEKQMHLFDDYVSDLKADNDGVYTSHGLGLAFCKMAIDAMHGEIHVESELDKGTKIFIDLPRVKIYA